MGRCCLEDEYPDIRLILFYEFIYSNGISFFSLKFNVIWNKVTIGIDFLFFTAFVGYLEPEFVGMGL